MIEQTIRKYNNRNDRFWKKVFRFLQLTSLFVLGVGAYFGFTVNSFYWHIDRTVFWQSCFYLLLMCLPLLIFVLVLHGLICKVGLEYDYELSGNILSVYRLLGSRRKFYLSFDLNNVTLIREISNIRSGSREEGLLRSAKAASCNEDAPHLFLLQVSDCRLSRRVADVCVLVELNSTFYAALSRKLHI